jgi:hypothetical protein
VSREFGEELGWCLIVETAQAGAIVIGNKAVEVGVAFGMIEKPAVMGGTVFRHAPEMLATAAVEAFNHAVGLRTEGPGEAVGDGALDTELVEGVGSRGFVVRFFFLIDGEPIGEFGPVVGQDGVDCQREAGEEAFEEGGCGSGPAIGEDFEINKTGGAIDRDPSLRWGRL